MHHGHSIAFSFLFLTIQAQTVQEIEVGNRNYGQVFDSLSTGLIPSRIPYGILMDRVYGWAGLTEWNSGDTVTASHLFQTWYDGEEAYINPVQRPANYLAMRDTVDRMLYQVKLPVLAFAYQFGFIDSLALQDGRLSTVNGILTDNNNTLPYISKQISLAGLATEDVFQNKSYLLYFDPSIVFNNTGFTIQSITVLNLVTNSQYILTANNGVAIQFASSGINTLRFTIQLSNGSSYTTHQCLNVKAVSTSNTIALRPVGPDCTPVSQLLTSTIPFQGYAETDATNSHADVHFYYHTISPTSSNCEQVLRKPIIIVDGFDPENTRSHFNLYNDNLSYSRNGNPSRLGDDLRDKGYDVIILNFPKLGSVINDENGNALLSIPATVKLNGTATNVNRNGRDGGADYIERNAMLLVKLIQDVNATLAANGSTEKIVVVGPSMGGLISRYALAYMEKQQSLGVVNMNHNCRVWVSFDSPHDGANISIAAQQTIGFFGNTMGSQDSKNAYDNKLRAVAARQQLIEQMDGRNSAATFHSAFYANLKNNGLPGSNGFPTNLRKVNLLNGAGNGTDTYGAGTEVLSGEAFTRVFGINIKVVDIEDNFMPSPGTNAKISKTMASASGFLYFNQFTSTYTFTNNNTRGSMDAVQGSINNSVIPMIKDGLDKSKEKKIQKLIKNWYTFKPNFCFVPTISALGFKQPVTNWHTRVDDRNLLCNNEINFDSYFSAPTNEPHIFLTEANVNWVMQEIEKGQPGCPTICTFSITGGSNTLCVNNSATYSLDAAPPSGTTLQWILSSNLQLVSSVGTSITVKAIEPGSASVTAKIINNCGANVELVRTISISSPSPSPSGTYASPSSNTELLISPINRFDLTTFNAACLTVVTNMTIPSGATVSWTGSTNSSEVTWYQSGNNLVIYFNALNQTADMNIYVTTSCGTTSAAYRFKCTSTTSCGGITPLRVALSPNPASSSIQISLEEKADKTKKRDIREVKVIDKMGNIKLKNNYGSGQKIIYLNVSSFPADVYTIQIFDGHLWTSEKFIKN